jgi:hypothetical protein
VAVKAWVKTTATSFASSAVDKEKWITPDDAIASVVKLHGQTLAGYKQSGLG